MLNLILKITHTSETDHWWFTEINRSGWKLWDETIVTKELVMMVIEDMNERLHPTYVYAMHVYRALAYKPWLCWQPQIIQMSPFIMANGGLFILWSHNLVLTLMHIPYVYILVCIYPMRNCTRSGLIYLPKTKFLWKIVNVEWIYYKCVVVKIWYVFEYSTAKPEVVCLAPYF